MTETSGGREPGVLTQTAGLVARGPGVLSEGARAEIAKLAAMYPERRTALLPALKLAQAEVGYLPREAIAEAADLVGVPHSAALELVSFYTMLFAEQGPPQRLVVCAQLPCALRGAEQLLRDLRNGLRSEIETHSIDVERTTECFGACHKAPMARLGNDYRENLDEDGRRRLIDELSSQNGRAQPGAADERTG